MSRVHTPMPRECAVCHSKKPESVLQYAERRRSGVWRPYLAHASCTGSTAPTTPKPRKPKRRTVKRTG